MQERHGGNIYKAIKDYGLWPDSILDFSANINPLGIPEELKDIIKSKVDSLKDYPDPECLSLREAISGYLNIGVDKIIPGNGASEIIFLLFEVMKLKKVLIPAPSFAEYTAAAERYGTLIDYFRLEEDEGFQLNVDRLIESTGEDVEAVMLCNPNNPTSTLISRESLVRLIEHMNKKGVYVIVDEAFIELTGAGNNNSVCDFIEKYNNLFIIRAFTKIFSIPGLRLGYGLGSTEIIKRMWERKLPWSVNTFACSMGDVLANGREYFTRTSDWLIAEKKRFFEELSQLKELKVFEPQTNFILIKILNENFNSAKLKDIMGSRGILIRDASNFKFLDERYIRVAIKDKESNRKLKDLLGTVLKE